MHDPVEEKVNAPDIGLMRPEDAAGVVGLYRATYGEAYPIKEMYDPEYLLGQQERNEMYHIVARNREGRVVGHLALFRTSAPFPGIWEQGHGMVLAEYRNLGLNNLMLEYDHREVIPRLGIEQIWGEAVANHIYMQKTGILLGSSETGIALDLMPASSYEKERSSTGRVSAVLTFKTFKPKAQTIFLPRVYEEIMRSIYETAYDFGHTYLVSDKVMTGKKESSVQVIFFEGAGVARFTVFEIGDDLRERIRQVEREVTDRGAVILQVYLKLTDPRIGMGVDGLRECGYFLGGVLPRWFDDDGMMMQKIMHEPNFDGIKLYTDKAKKLLAFIRKDREEVTGRE